MVDDKSDKARSLFKDKMTRMAKSHLQGAVEGILSDGAFWEDAELVLHDELEQSIAHLTFDPASGLQVGIRAGSDQSEAYVFIPLEWDIYRAEREENQDDYFPEVDIMDGADNSVIDKTRSQIKDLKKYLDGIDKALQELLEEETA